MRKRFVLPQAVLFLTLWAICASIVTAADNTQKVNKLDAPVEFIAEVKAAPEVWGTITIKTNPPSYITRGTATILPAKVASSKLVPGKPFRCVIWASDGERANLPALSIIKVGDTVRIRGTFGRGQLRVDSLEKVAANEQGKPAADEPGEIKSAKGQLIKAVKRTESITEPWVKLKGIVPMRDLAANNFQWSKVTEVKTADEAAKFFDRKNLTELKKQVDFKKQKLVIFAWRGSGGDTLSAITMTKRPEAVVFQMRAGRQDDLRYHLQVYALRQEADWEAQTK